MTIAVPTALAPKRAPWREASPMPGFGLSMGFTLLYVSLIILLPLAALLARPWEHGIGGFFTAILRPRTLAALRLSFTAAFLAALANVVFGLLLAWALTRYRFPFRKIIDAMVDLPFALPTAVAGIALAALYGPNGWIGELLARIGVKVAYTPRGVVVALAAVGLPFVVRSVQPVLADLDAAYEEAARTLGANAVQAFTRVTLPALTPALITGFAMAFARGVGEYGSVIFIAGNMPGVSEIAPLVIITNLEQYDYSGAAAVGVAMLALSLAALLVTNTIQILVSRRGAA